MQSRPACAVTLESTREAVVFDLADDGRGFDPNGPSDRAPADQVDEPNRLEAAIGKPTQDGAQPANGVSAIPLTPGSHANTHPASGSSASWRSVSVSVADVM